MMNKLLSPFRRISYRKRLFISILIPLMIVLFFNAVTDFYFLTNFKKQVLEKCRVNHDTFSTGCEQTFTELYQASVLFMENAEFRNICFSFSPLTPEEYFILTDARSALSAFGATLPYIMQVGFVNEVNNRYISSRCTEFLESYYGNEGYGTVVNQRDYLDSYQKRSSILQFQPLDSLSGQAMIPILQFEAGSYNLTFPLIYYLNEETLSSMLSRFRYTPNSELAIYCAATDQIIASTSDALSSPLLDAVQPGAGWPKECFSLRIDGKKYYCLSSVSQTNYTDPLLFLTLIPDSDILSATMVSWIVSLLVLAFCSVLVCALSFYFSFRLYLPIRNIIHTSVPDAPSLADSSNGDEFALLENRIRGLLEDNKQLQNSMSNALPLIYNRYILNILHQRDYDNQILKPLLVDFDFAFPYPYFTCGVLIPSFSPSFYRDFTLREQDLIIGKLSEVLKLTKSKNTAKYVFHLENNSYCIIANSMEEQPAELLKRDFAFLQELFSFDRDYICFYIAFGSTIKSIDGLPLSWKQANTAMASLSSFRQEYIRFYSPEAETISSYVSGPEDDNHLSSYLFKGDYAAVSRQLEKLLKMNEDLNITENGLKNLYIHLYELGNTVLHRREENGYELMQDSYISLSVFVRSLNNLQRSNYITEFYKALCMARETESDTTFDLEQIKQFVDTHYCEEIYLESLAQQFRTSPKYMSRLLKQALGVPFKQYLTNLRIARACELLISTDMKIEEIAIACGFTSRNSFIRVFKQLQGATPSEYRSYTKKQ